jgi:hypothetical protein
MRASRFRQFLCRTLQYFLLASLVALTAQAQKIQVTYDPALDFAKFKTYAWGQHDAVSRPMLALAIAGAIEHELTQRGLQKTDSHPDLYVQMYGSTDSDMAVSYSDLYSGYAGIPPFDQNFLIWGTVGSTTTVVVHKGQLVVDLIDASQHKIAWRGVAKEKLSDEKLKLVDQVNIAVEKMFKKYPTGTAR